MELKTKYITVEDFKQYFGIDLANSLKTNDNPSEEAEAFLKRIEDRMATYIDCNYYRQVDFEYPKLTNYQKEHYKLALLEQAIYVLKNGDISVDSGYDMDEGIKANRQDLRRLSLSENAKQNLILCGFINRKIKNRGRSGLDGWWMY